MSFNISVTRIEALTEMLRQSYAAHVKWLNVCHDTQYSDNIDHFYTASRNAWLILGQDSTLQKIVAQYDILSALINGRG